MMKYPRNITPCRHLPLVIKIVDRIRYHITGIAEQIDFVERAGLSAVDRKKGSNMSSTIADITIIKSFKLGD